MERDHDSGNSIVFTFETIISEIQAASKQIKKFKPTNKLTDIQLLLSSLLSKPPFPKQRFRKYSPKRDSKNISI